MTSQKRLVCYELVSVQTNQLLEFNMSSRISLKLATFKSPAAGKVGCMPRLFRCVSTSQTKMSVWRSKVESVPDSLHAKRKKNLLPCYAGKLRHHGPTKVVLDIARQFNNSIKSQLRWIFRCSDSRENAHTSADHLLRFREIRDRFQNCTWALFKENPMQSQNYVVAVQPVSHSYIIPLLNVGICE